MIASLMFLLLLQMPAEDEAWQKLKSRIELAPQDVATFIERRTGCNHFEGEVGGEYPEREAQLQSVLGELRCNDLEADARRLARKYKAQPRIVQLLAETEELMLW